MSKRILGTVLALAAAAALAVSAAAAPAAKQARRQVPVTIAMHDPGCHWFAVGSTYRKYLVVNGIADVRNVDEATLIFKGPGGFSALLPVGHVLQVARPGDYRVTMVGQAPDDNHLVLRVAA